MVNYVKVMASGTRVLIAQLFYDGPHGDLSRFSTCAGRPSERTYLLDERKLKLSRYLCFHLRIINPVYRFYFAWRANAPEIAKPTPTLKLRDARPSWPQIRIIAVKSQLRTDTVEENHGADLSTNLFAPEYDQGQSISRLQLLLFCLSICSTGDAKHAILLCDLNLVNLSSGTFLLAQKSCRSALFTFFSRQERCKLGLGIVTVSSTKSCFPLAVA